MTGPNFQFVAKVGTISTFHASFSSLLIPQITGETEDPHTPGHSAPRWTRRVCFPLRRCH